MLRECGKHSLKAGLASAASTPPRHSAIRSGGFKQCATYDGVLELHLDADLKKMGLWKGLCFHVNGFQIHGQSIAADYVGSLATISNLEATPATRLYELWLEQSMFNGKVRVKFGQLVADGDFFVRSEPGSVKLPADSAAEYIRTRFSGLCRP